MPVPDRPRSDDAGTAVFAPDGTSEGFLTALSLALEAGPGAAVADAGAGEGGFLFGAPARVSPDPARVARLLDLARARISPAAARRLYYASLADVPGAGALALAYLRLGLELGAAVDEYQADARVRRLQTLTSRVGGEIHRLKGLVRFRQLEDGALWAPIEPDHRVLLPVAFHFRRRMPGERWLLHDVRRGRVAVWDRRSLREMAETAAGPAGAAPDRRLSRDEEACAEMWRAFFRRIAVPGRENPKLQAQNMPRRYWRHLVELCE